MSLILLNKSWQVSVSQTVSPIPLKSFSLNQTVLLMSLKSLSLRLSLSFFKHISPSDSPLISLKSVSLRLSLITLKMVFQTVFLIPLKMYLPQTLSNFSGKVSPSDSSVSLIPLKWSLSMRLSVCPMHINIVSLKTEMLLSLISLKCLLPPLL